MRLAFMGTSEFAVPALEQLVSAGFTARSVFTQPDRPSGRGQKIRRSPIKEAAQSLGLDVYQPDTLSSASFRGLIEGLAPEIIVVVAYGRILPPWLVRFPSHGVVNLHASLLPKYRGAAPINWAIANGETRTGVCTMKIDRGLDSGPVYRCLETEIGSNETAPELSLRLAAMGAPLLVQTVQAISRGETEAHPQDESQATLARRLVKEDGYVHWEESAGTIHNKIRAFVPWPGVIVGFRGVRCRLLRSCRTRSAGPEGLPGEIRLDGSNLRACCGDGSWLGIESLQLENRRAVSGLDFANGVRLEPGEGFTSVGETSA